MLAQPGLSCVTLKIWARHFPGSLYILVLRAVLGVHPEEEAVSIETSVQVTQYTKR